MLKLRRTTLQSRHMNVVVPQITANMIASLTFCSGEKRTKYQISASLLSFAHAISPIGGGFHSQWARNVKNPIFCATLFFLTRWPWKHNKSTVCFSTAKLNYLTCLSFFHHVSYLLRILCYINLPKFGCGWLMFYRKKRQRCCSLQLGHWRVLLQQLNELSFLPPLGIRIQWVNIEKNNEDWQPNRNNMQTRISSTLPIYILMTCLGLLKSLFILCSIPWWWKIRYPMKKHQICIRRYLENISFYAINFHYHFYEIAHRSNWNQPFDHLIYPDCSWSGANRMDMQQTAYKCCFLSNDFDYAQYMVDVFDLIRYEIIWQTYIHLFLFVY